MNPNGTGRALNFVSLSVSFSSAVARVGRAGQLRRPAVQHRPHRRRPRQARAVVQEQLFPPRLHVSNKRKRNTILRRAASLVRGFVNNFLRVPLAFLGSMEAAEQLWNSQETLYTNLK